MGEIPKHNKIIRAVVLIPVVAIIIATLFIFFTLPSSKQVLVPGKPHVTVPPFYANSSPQTVLLLGLDYRHGDKRRGITSRSDTIIIARMDPQRGIALLSLPRDLQVEIPGHGRNKINAAYSLGGSRLTLQTVNKLTGLGITQYAATKFDAFSKAVNALGCAYLDIDRRYFHSNNGLPIAQRYTTVNVQSGYQRICGLDTLSYVRQREQDSDITRIARQQGFLIQFKQQFTLKQLAHHWRKLLSIFRKYTTTNMNRLQLLGVTKTALASSDKPVYELRFPVTFGTSDVHANVSQIRAAARKLVKVVPQKSQQQTRSQKKAVTVVQVKRCPRIRGNSINMTTTAQSISRKTNLPTYYPRMLFGTDNLASTRTYKIATPDKHSYPAYRLVFSAGILGEYYGIQGTTWSSPPFILPPYQTWMIHHQKYRVFLDGKRIRVIAWQTSQGTYWLSNTLQQVLSSDKMLSIICRLSVTK